jgi:FkbM family methyltransferase
MNFQTKLKLFKFIQTCFAKLNLKIFYTKDKDFSKNMNVKNIIDVGVEKGTNFLTKKFPKANFFLVEANSSFYDYLENEFLEKYKGKLFKIAAGSKDESKFFYQSGPISSFFKRDNFVFNKRIKVQIKPLDKILVKEKFSKNTLLKIDCEGGELDVLKGAVKVLSKVNYVIIELRLQKIETYNPTDIISFLYKNKFKWKQILKVYYAKEGIDYIDILFTKIK